MIHFKELIDLDLHQKKPESHYLNQVLGQFLELCQVLQGYTNHNMYFYIYMNSRNKILS